MKGKERSPSFSERERKWVAITSPPARTLPRKRSKIRKNAYNLFRYLNYKGDEKPEADSGNSDKKFLKTVCECITDKSFLPHNKTSILYQTFKEDPDWEEHLKGVSHKKIEHAKNYMLLKDSGSTLSEKVKGEARKKVYRNFIRLYNGSIYRPLNSSIGSKNKLLDYFLEHAKMFSFLDSQFNYLRQPDLYPAECANVIKAYYAAYLAIVSPKKKNGEKPLPAVYENKEKEGVSLNSAIYVHRKSQSDRKRTN